MKRAHGAMYSAFGFRAQDSDIIEVDRGIVRFGGERYIGSVLICASLRVPIVTITVIQVRMLLDYTYLSMRFVLLVSC